MKRFILILITVLLPLSVALAAVLTFNWTNATQNTDGTPIPATGPGSISETRVTYGTCNATKTAIATVLGTVTTTGTGTSGVTPNLAPGIYCGSAQHVNTFGLLSVPSNVASKEILAPTPKAPTNFGIG